MEGRKWKRIEDYSAFKSEIEIPEINIIPFDPLNEPDPDFSLSVFIRMLYSCLVDADFLDTEKFMKNGQTHRDSGEGRRCSSGETKRPCCGLAAERRYGYCKWKEEQEILRHCFESGRRERGIFQLTVPTGGGKTIASLAFALQHAVENHMDRVIYVIPYTSIIEQNAEVFRRILGDQNVLENHYNVDYESSEELRPMQLASENWDKPVVVTTNVHFFEFVVRKQILQMQKVT